MLVYSIRIMKLQSIKREQCCGSGNVNSANAGNHWSSLIWGTVGGSRPRGFGLAVAGFSIPGAYNNLPSALRHCWDG